MAEWGDPSVPEMASEGPARRITWEHLLQQTSQWEGQLWGKPAAADTQSRRPGTHPDTTEPGSGWAYNDVRVNLLCLALTTLLRAPLPEVLGECVLDPLGASKNWAWHGYSNSYATVDGRRIPVVSGGAHWGGGLFVSAHDLALIGRLLLLRGRWRGRSLLGNDWITRSWQPCPVKPDYGYLWWLNRERQVFPEAPATGVCARGNRSQHVLWLDPARDLVIAAHWSPGIGEFIGEISRCVPRVGSGK
ncbi:serine hydrolase [Amycolatopsis lurida]